MWIVQVTSLNDVDTVYQVILKETARQTIDEGRRVSIPFSNFQGYALLLGVGV